MGDTSWTSVKPYLSGCLKNELVGLDELGVDCWRVHFGPVLIGVLDANKTRALNNDRRFGLLVRADGHLRKKRRRRPYRR